ncbi:hypothetical protein KAX97_04715 [candidate division WOR-3 bacterium]|nr:hypothetical protein [candidate division WOR-3 bacterium]
MAIFNDLGLVLEDEDAKRFWEDQKNPTVTKEQIEMFREARRIVKNNFKFNNISYYTSSDNLDKIRRHIQNMAKQ